MALLLSTGATGCGREPEPATGQEVGWIESASFDGPPGTAAERTRLAGGGTRNGWPWFSHFRLQWRSPEDKLDPRLRRWLASHPPRSYVEVLVEYSDPVRLPPFPMGDEAGNDPVADSLAKIGASAIVDSLTILRAPWYSLERTRLARDFGAAVLDSFWISRSFVVRLRAGHVRRLAQRNDVRTVQLAHGGPHAPFDCSALGSLSSRDALVGDGRALLNSDPLRDLGYSRGRLSLLDTGVWTGHQLLKARALSGLKLGPSLFARDCEASPACTGADPGDTDVGQGGHGTATCGILVGDGSMGECLEGVTRAGLTCYRVYIPDPETSGSTQDGMLDPTAYKHACERVLADRSPVAIIEVAEQQDPYAMLGDQAATLYENGIAVIVAAGNGYSSSSPGASWVGAPGNHPWVLAVGARNTNTPSETEYNQSRGRVGFRTKPDLQAPTVTSSAGLGGVEELLNLGGTSGATPYGGAAALILRNWLRSLGAGPSGPRKVDPGQVYAAMLACCDGRRVQRADATDPEFPVATGAGLIRLPSQGHGWWGKLRMGSFSTQEFPFPVPDTNVKHLGVAIWWADSEPYQLAGSGVTVLPHADFDLELVAPDGQVRARSAGQSGVFERLDAPTGNVAPGAWRLRVLAREVGPGKKTAYVAAIARP